MKTKISKLGRRGKTVLAVLVAVMFIGVASAALVPYLSNDVEAEITVSSPMLVGISSGRASWATTQCKNTDPDDPKYGEMVDSFPEGVDEDDYPIYDWDESDWEDSTITISGIHGGETVTIYTRSVNLANVEITGFEKAIVRNWAGVTSNDFKSVLVRTDSIYGGIGYGTVHELIPNGCSQVPNDPYRVQFGSPDASTWGVGETDVTEIVVTFMPNAFGTYTFTYQIVPEI